MQLRSGRLKKCLFATPVASPINSPAFYTPRAVTPAASKPAPSVSEQKKEQDLRLRERTMAESVAALEQCLLTTRGKVERIRQAIERAGLDHGKFSIHSLHLYVKTVDAAYDEYNGFQTRIYLADPSKREEYEPKFVEFEELYEFVRIALSEMIQKYDDAQKAIAEVALAERQNKLLEYSASNPGSSRSSAPVQIVPSLLLQQTPLPTFDGTYDNWYKFRDRFKDIVNKCTEDSPATKLHYLDKALVGRAQGSIDQQTLNDNNYEGAWRILTKKYENLRMVVQGHVTQLLSLKPMVKGAHAELRSLIDVVDKRLESLAFHNLKMEDKLSEAIIVNLVISKLDLDTRKAWEATVEHGKLPKYTKMMDFLREYCYMLERCEQTAYGGKPKNAAPTTRSSMPAVSSKVHTVTVQQPDSCPVCNDEHLVDVCDAFEKMNVSNRYAMARQFGLCFACLKKGHRTVNCKLESSKWCPCKRKHHPLMHGEDRRVTSDEATATTEVQPDAGGSGSTNETPKIVAKCEVPVPLPAQKQVLLATAVIDVVDVRGVAHRCRALLDSGAMANFVSERMSDLLGLRKEYVNIPVVGVNGAKSTVKFKISATVKSRTTDYSFSMDYLVVPRVTGALPSMKLDAAGWPIPRSLQLADPKFFDPSRIDMLLGAEVFYDLVLAGKIRMAEDLPLLQESLLGWLISGTLYSSEKTAGLRICQATTTERIDEQLYDLMKRFWEIDEQRNEPSQSNDCEEHFKATYARAADGRYVVKLPFREDARPLGESRYQAEKRFKALENRLDRCPEMKEMYKEFVHGYLDNGHAKILNSTEIDSEGAYYLPHHCVLKPDSSTTKLRVVFDASAKTTTDVSLNDVLMEAPTVQSPLFDIILRWRLHKYVFTADVQQMYRQVVVDDADTKYQRFLWRDERTQQLMDIELQRVTYGIGPAGFLATRSLVQLANDERDSFPEACEVVVKSFYVDDTLSGADTVEKAKKLRDDLRVVLRKGGFKLHKWCANDPAILEGVVPEDQEKLMSFEDNEVNGVIKTLGLLWDPTNDDFLFRVNPMVNSSEALTKRQVLAEIARLFDPLGVLGPIVVLAKMVMQQLWRKKIGWDDPIPEEELQSWMKLRSELCEINNMRIPRRVTINNPVVFELLGFSDASRGAYGCCIYLKSVAEDGAMEIKLLCGKSRVSPLKEIDRKEAEDASPAEMTIPRLELCAAVLLAKQVKTVRETLGIDIKRVVLRSDSEIVLWWLRRVKPDQSVFVRNRILEIQQLVPDAEWLHVRTGDNPADLISRGVLPMDLMKNSLWWNGPDFLYSNETEVNVSGEEDCVNEDDEEACERTVAVVEAEVKQGLDPYEVIQNSGRFRKLQRVFGHVARFIHNARAKRVGNERRLGRLSAIDYRDSLYLMARIVQHSVYREEIKNILQNRPATGKLQNLSPIYDEAERLLRVGGRIRNSDLPRDQKHPIILPERNHFTELVIEAIHREQLHVGLNGLLAKVREQFYPVQAKRTIHRVLRNCIKCFRMKPKDVKQYMGDLPSARVTAAQPFERTGVDYAGPFYLKQGRSKAPIKAYVSVFVCMSTKAIHFELVCTLSTEGFLGALHRFAGRRGIASRMFSDNGTNFVGAERQLTELKGLLDSQLLERELEEFCQPRGIDWSFNPPKAPHQGGLWEAGVKSMKTHLYKVMSQAYLTYEEMLTLLVQIEAILNSRPLIQQSDDPTDYQALTPGHFLIGRALTAVPEPFYDGLKENTLSRYQLIQKRKQAFWKRWSSEYITGLQKRSKWFKQPTLLKEGLMVVLKDDNMPPQTWKLGRIVQVHPGADGIVRVVTVRTSGGTYKRPTTQIAVLPIDDETTGESSEVLSHPAPGGGC